MSLQPGQYGYAQYDVPKYKDEEKEKKYLPGKYVLWKSKGVVGQVIADWGGYGVQIEYLDAKGKWVRGLVPKWDSDHSNLLEALARAAS
jgi:hypothetical protein